MTYQNGRASASVIGDPGEILRAVSLPVLAGLLVRAIPVLTADFPLNDGGLFYAMTRDLQAANYLLPATTSYNGLDIPFAYPPLGFYLAAFLSGVGIGMFDIFRFVPLILATLMIPAVYLVAREILSTRFQALLATWAFAFLPRSFDWLIVGGGLTRSLGLLLAILAILEGIRFYRTNLRWHGVAMAILAALTALSHPEAALFAGLSIAVMLVAYGRRWRALRDSFLLAVVAAILAAPWWLSVLATHGLGPFLSGGQTGFDLASSFQHLVTFTFTDEPYAAFLAVAGLIGLVQQLATRRYLLPLWVVVVFAIDPRGAATGAMLPLAMLIAVAVDEVLLARIPHSTVATGTGGLWPTEVTRDRFGRLLLGTALLLGVIGAVKAPTGIGSPLHSLGQTNRAAMAWIEASAPPSTDFLVVSGSAWFIDPNSEWFPVLTGHRSLATVQGSEWLGKAAWDRQLGRYHELQQCVSRGADCLAAWVRQEGAADAWIYVPMETIGILSPTDDCCEAFRTSMAAAPGYELVYTGPGGAVYKPTG